MDFLSKLFQGRQLQRSREVLELFRAPQMTSTERDELKNPKNGMLIWNETTSKLQVYTGSWIDLH